MRKEKEEENDWFNKNLKSKQRRGKIISWMEESNENENEEGREGENER